MLSSYILPLLIRILDKRNIEFKFDCFFSFSGKCLFLSGLVPRPMNAENDRELLGFGIGFTNIVERTTRANQELTRQEIEEGKLKIQK